MLCHTTELPLIFQGGGGGVGSHKGNVLSWILKVPNFKILRLWKDIIIRPLDKGVGFFLMHEEEYLRRFNVHLQNGEVYKVVAEPPSLISELIAKIQNWTEKCKTEIGMTSKIIKWVIPSAETHQPGNVYFNLKAHKPPLYPGRLITTGCGALIENLSALTAFELKKYKLD